MISLDGERRVKITPRVLDHISILNCQLEMKVIIVGMAPGTEKPGRKASYSDINFMRAIDKQSEIGISKTLEPLVDIRC
jgi:hypothetical protein